MSQRQRDVLRYIRKLRREGWNVIQGKKHWKAYHPVYTQRFITISESPSCQFWQSHVEQDIRRLERDVLPPTL